MRQILVCAGMLMLVVACGPDQESQRIHDKNGVTVDRVQGRTLGVDASKGGAVLCARVIYVSLYSDIQHCDDPRIKPFLTDMREDIDKIDRFIVANTPGHPGLDTQRHDTQSEISKAANRPPLTRICERFASVPDGTLAEARKQYRHDIERLLAVPRLPVMNPCL